MYQEIVHRTKIEKLKCNLYKNWINSENSSVITDIEDKNLQNRCILRSNFQICRISFHSKVHSFTPWNNWFESILSNVFFFTLCTYIHRSESTPKVDSIVGPMEDWLGVSLPLESRLNCSIWEFPRGFGSMSSNSKMDIDVQIFVDSLKGLRIDFFIPCT